MIVKSTLQTILDERGISVLKLAKDIDYRYESVRLLYNNDNKTYPRELLTKICAYLKITPGELLTIEIDDPDC